MRLLLFATSCKETQSALQGGKWKNTFHAYPAQMAFPMGVVWTVQFILVAPSTLPLARSACGGTQRGR